jgi:lipopolysaccharide/colanic/teichoic acid biosynthesis glycosyltransferase
VQDKFIRFFDIFFSSIALLVLTPLLIPIMIILRFTGEYEIFYLQERIGKNGKPFKIVKFATMLKNSPHMGTGTVTVKNDPRVFPFGKFLRKTKINELPQLINILKGDMSIVGPRPRTKQFFEALPIEYRKTISKIKPGLSGIGSIIFRNEDEILQKVNDPYKFDLYVITPYKAELEMWYMKNRNIKTYFELILITVVVLLFSNKFNIFDYYRDLPKPPKELEKFLLKQSYKK